MFRGALLVPIAALVLSPIFAFGQASHSNFKEEFSKERIPKSIAFHRGINRDNGQPNWKGKPHPKCQIEWSILANQGGTVLYRARYSWPSEEIEGLEERNYRVVTEVIFEGKPKGRFVSPIFSIACDETYEFLDPIKLHLVKNLSVIEISICLNGTGGCVQEFLSWKPGNLRSIGNRVRQDVNKWLPSGYETWKSPTIDIPTLTGFSGAWRNGDGNCCPSKFVNFRLSLSPDEIRIYDLSLDPEPNIPKMAKVKNDPSIPTSWPNPPLNRTPPALHSVLSHLLASLAPLNTSVQAGAVSLVR